MPARDGCEVHTGSYHAGVDLETDALLRLRILVAKKAYDTLQASGAMRTWTKPKRASLVWVAPECFLPDRDVRECFEDEAGSGARSPSTASHQCCVVGNVDDETRRLISSFGAKQSAVGHAMMDCEAIGHKTT